MPSWIDPPHLAINIYERDLTINTQRQSVCINPIDTITVVDRLHINTLHEQALHPSPLYLPTSSNAINSQTSPPPAPHPRPLNRSPLPRRNILGIF